ncbi:MAG: type VI secretion system baseplate subunit TssF [Alphaproteobacteria bacterium]
MTKSSDLQLMYYQKEMSFLRQMGGVFAAKYPKIARRLSFTENQSADPHVERLLESFAFLSGYLQQDIDNQFPRLSSALLSILYPFLTNPIPPMSVAQFKPDTQKPMTTSYPIPKHFSVFTEAYDGEICRFRTCYPIDLWPLDVSDVAMVKTEKYDFGSSVTDHAYFMKISLKAQGTPLNKLDIKKLRFYINAHRTEANILYQLLFEEDHQIAVVGGGTTKILGAGSIKQVGFSEDEAAIPTPANGHPAYGLLQEYFAFPKKYMFFDLEGLDFSHCKDSVEIFIPVSSPEEAKGVAFSKNTFLLGCAPIINLFPRTTEPIRFDHKKIEYRLVPDYRREMTTEIYSLEKVFSSNLDAVEVQEIGPYFSYDHHSLQNKKTFFWFGRRTPSSNPRVPGTDYMLSFVNWECKPELPSTEVVYARTLCTNRHLATMVSGNTVLQEDEGIPASSIICLHPPTVPIYPDKEGATQWQLISNLSLSYLSLSSETESLDALKEILKLYSVNESRDVDIEITRLLDMKCDQTVRRLGKDAWRGFTKGMAVTLTLDEGDSYSLGTFLFSAVLSHFLGLYTHINSFTELSIKKKHQEQIWKTWPAIAGTQPLL